MDDDATQRDRVERIVFVDDERDVLDSIVRDLDGWIAERGLETIAVTSGREALEQVGEDYPRTGLLVSDLRMPGMSGADLFTAVAAQYPEVGLVMVTAYSDMAAITRAVAASMLGLIQKPWDPDRLAAELDRALSIVERGRALVRQTHELGILSRRAARYRASFLGLRRHTDRRIDVSTFTRPGPERTVTQDLFGVRRLPGGETLAYVGESTQDTISSALLTAVVRLHAETWTGPPDPSQFMGSLINRLVEHGLLEDCPPISLSVVVLDPPTLHVACSGEPRACVVNERGVHWPQTFGRAIMNDAERVASGESTTISVGDRVVLFSDGFLDQPERTNGRPPGVKLEPLLLRAHQSSEFEDTVVRLLTADRILKNMSTVPLFRDDATIISLRYVGEKA